MLLLDFLDIDTFNIGCSFSSVELVKLQLYRGKLQQKAAESTKDETDSQALKAVHEPNELNLPMKN